MARVAGIALFSLILLVRFAPATHRIENQRKPEKGQAERAERPSPTAASLWALAAKPTSPESSGQTDDSGNDSHDWCDWYAAFGPPTWSNWALTIAATVAACIAVSTLRAIKRQTEATKLSERAWVAFDIGQIGGMEDLVSLWRSPDALNRQKDSIVCILSLNGAFINGGKTIGRIKNGVIKFLCADPKKLPAEPNYYSSAGGKVPEALVLPNGRAGAGGSIYLEAEALSKLFNQSAALIIYGVVSYDDIWKEPRDALKEPHESRFCMICRFPRLPGPLSWVADGPDGYNRYT